MLPGFGAGEKGTCGTCLGMADGSSFSLPTGMEHGCGAGLAPTPLPAGAGKAEGWWCGWTGDEEKLDLMPGGSLRSKEFPKAGVLL